MRECILKGTNQKALFHCWSQNSYIVEPSYLVGGHNGGVVSYTTAIVELKNGEVIVVHPNEIIFTEPPEPKDNFELLPQVIKDEMREGLCDVWREHLKENRDIGAYENIHNG